MRVHSHDVFRAQLTRLLKQQGYSVYTTCRNSTPELQAADVQVIQGKLADEPDMLCLVRL